MKILVVLGHPRPGSYNHALAGAVCETLRQNAHDIVFHDLYAENFPPLLTPAEIPHNAALDPVIARHCAELAAAEGIVIIHPNWSGQPPAILKGWIDRVFRSGVAYRYIEEGGSAWPVGLLKAGAAVVINTSDTPAAVEKEVFGDPLDTIWRNCVLGFAGVKNVHRQSFGPIITSAAEQRRQWLGETVELVNEVFSRS
jgi:NAD(P)H dehydrogenase (quinone)